MHAPTRHTHSPTRARHCDIGGRGQQVYCVMDSNTSFTGCPNRPLTSDLVFLLLRITGGTTALLSVLGASLIIFTYVAFKNLRTTPRQLLVNLSVADIIVSLSHLVGLLAKYEYHFPTDPLAENSNYSSFTSPLCSAQGAFTAVGTVASFLWSMLIVVYMLVLTQSKTPRLRKIAVPVIYVISWGIPVVIVIVLAAKSYLGYNPDDSPGITSLVPRPSYEKIEKGSGQTCIGAVFLRNARGPRTVQCRPIRFK